MFKRIGSVFRFLGRNGKRGFRFIFGGLAFFRRQLDGIRRYARWLELLPWVPAPLIKEFLKVMDALEDSAAWLPEETEAYLLIAIHELELLLVEVRKANAPATQASNRTFNFYSNNPESFRNWILHSGGAEEIARAIKNEE